MEVEVTVKTLKHGSCQCGIGVNEWRTGETPEDTVNNPLFSPGFHWSWGHGLNTAHSSGDLVALSASLYPTSLSIRIHSLDLIFDVFKIGSVSATGLRKHCQHSRKPALVTPADLTPKPQRHPSYRDALNCPIFMQGQSGQALIER